MVLCVQTTALTLLRESAVSFGGLSSTSRSRSRIKINALADEITRKDFPSDFLFGAGCSAFQVEGAPTSGGRGNSIWDSFVHTPGKIRDGAVNYPGAYLYKYYEEDFRLAKELGFDAFRISISWTRIYPNGAGPESAAGIEYYNKLINAMIKAGLTPFVTLFHWETPQYLENDPNVLGFRTKNIVPYFVKFAETCFKHFGDRVKIWTTINELYIFSQMGYAYGLTAPGRCSTLAVSTNPSCATAAGDSSSEPYLVGHNLLLAHAAVYQLYKDNYKEHQKGICGFNPNHYGSAPYSDSEEDRLATQRYREFNSGWQVDPIVFGDYPKSMRDAIGDKLPKFTEEESELLKNSFDFLAHNYYNAYFIKHADVPKDPSERWFDNYGGFTAGDTNQDGEYIGPLTGPPEISWIRSCPSYLPPTLEWLKDRYGNIPCYISENGIMDKTTDFANESLDDQERITYIKDHLAAISLAIENKIDVKGYLHWSFQDNFEWSNGNQIRFGLVRVELNTQNRVLKSSAKWFKKFLENS